MDCISTKNPELKVSFLEAIQFGQAPDGGLFVPKSIPQISKKEWQVFSGLDFQELSVRLAQKWLTGELPPDVIQELTERALDFSVPLVSVTPNISVLELFHGPSASFKDFGARFLAQFLRQALQEKKKRAFVLTATSGDTGSAVAQGFYGMSEVDVILLYPSGKVSPLQEKQMTTLGKNVTALEMDGTFDDCQKLVKQAFSDPDLKSLGLTSANSINLGRLIPQSFYYVYASLCCSKCLAPTAKELQLEPGTYCVVPSGNLGNLTAGVLAKRMGAPITGFIVALNANDEFHQYLLTGNFKAKPSKKTLSNAMDVGNPSNLERLRSLYNGDFQKMRAEIQSVSVSDRETEKTIQDVFKKHQYLLDPHGAVGWAALSSLQQVQNTSPTPPPAGGVGRGVYILLETADPAKFSEIITPLIQKKIPMSTALQSVLKKKGNSILLPKKYEDFKKFLKKY